MKRALLGFFIAAAIVISASFAVKFWSESDGGFPYGQSSEGLEIKQKDPSFGAAEGRAFRIKSGDIEGEAMVTAAPMKSAGQSMVNAELVGVKSTFQVSRAPYGGHITSFIDCEANKYIKEQNVAFAGAQTQMIMAVATARRIFGSCSTDQIKFASMIWSGYDEVRKQVLTVKLFKPVNDASAINQSQEEIFKVFQKVISHPGGS